MCSSDLTHRSHLAHWRRHQIEHDIEIVDHQVENDIDIERARREDAEAVHLKEHGLVQVLPRGGDGGAWR